MTTATTPRQEEREARELHRRMERMRRQAERKRETDWQRRLREALAEIPKGTCRCNLRGVHSRGDLYALGGGCTAPNFVCPRLDGVRRRVAS